MRLKENRDNWRASNLTRKLALPPEQPIRRPRKNTTRWCKGKVGREHEYEVRVPQGGMFDRGMRDGSVRMPICKTCGKQDYRGIEYRCAVHGVWSSRAFWRGDANQHNH